MDEKDEVTGHDDKDQVYGFMYISRTRGEYVIVLGLAVIFQRQGMIRASDRPTLLSHSLHYILLQCIALLYCTF